MLLHLRFLAIVTILLLAGPSVADEVPHRTGDGVSLPAGARFRFSSLQLRHPGQIRNSALSPDGKLLATASGRTVMIWDLVAGRSLRQIKAAEGYSFSSPGLTFSPDGTRVGYAHNSEAAFVWDVKTGKEILSLGGQLQGIRQGQFTTDGAQFVIADKSGIYFWNAKTGIRDRFDPIERVNNFSPDAKFYVQLDEKQTTVVGDARTGKEIRKLDVAVANNGIENGIAFSPDSKWLALVNIDKAVELRNTETWELHVAFPLFPAALRGPRPDGSRYPYYRVALSPDAKLLYLGMGDGTLHRWDVNARKALPPLKVHETEIANIHCTADKQMLITTSRDGLIRSWHPITGAALAEPEGYAGPTHAALSSDGRLVVAGDARGRLDLWDAQSGKIIRNLRKVGPAVRKLAFDPTSTSFAMAQEDSVIALWHFNDGPTGKTLSLPKSKDERQRSVWVQAMRFSPDARHLYVCSWYRPMRYELATGKMETRGTSGDFALSADGALLATAYAAQLTFWDETTGKTRIAADLKGGRDGLGYPIALAFSPDRRLLAAGMRDGHIALLDTARGAERQRFFAVAVRKFPAFFPERDPYHATALQFSPDGRWLISGGNDHHVRLWETATGKQLAEFGGHETDVSEIVFGPDARTAFSSAADGQSYLWDLRPAGLVKNTAEGLWEALGLEDAERAFRAIWALANDPRAAAELLRSKIAAAPAPDPARVRQWIADLSSDEFRVRDVAQQELNKLADLAAQAIQEALEKPLTLEAKRRLEKLQSALQQDPSHSKLREIRAIQALELAAASETNAVLRQWAKGAPGADRTKNAQAALERVERRIKTRE